jgi:hypothetical protein
MDDYQKESWVSLYQSALMEIEHAKMTGRIDDARTAIVARLEKLRSVPGLLGEERQAIEDSLRTLRFLEGEEERYQAKENRLALEKAAKKLQSIAPAIERNKTSL